MKKRMMEIAILTAASALVLGVSSCTTGMGGTETTDVEVMDDGVMMVDTISMSATVVGKDASNRKLTLQSNDTGEKKSFKAPKEMTNFAQVNVGDQVNVVVTEEVAVYIGAGAPPSAATAGSVMLSPDGTKPAGIVTQTSQVTAVVAAVNAQKHKVTLKLPDGTTKKVSVGKDMDMASVVVGETVTVVVGEGLALSVTAP